MLGLIRTAALLALMMTVPALAQMQSSSGPVCPYDRPIERTVATGMANCTLVMCVGTLVCPDDETKNCYRLPPRDCNTCTQIIQTVCLTAEELKAAREK